MVCSGLGWRLTGGAGVIFLCCWVVLVAAADVWSAGSCLAYGKRVTLAGKLIRQTFPGPPNYESVANGDKPETNWYIELTAPMCVDADPQNRQGAVSDVGQVELVVTPEQYRRHRDLVGRSVRASGILFQAFTGHHHTPVLLSDVRFEK